MRLISARAVRLRLAEAFRLHLPVGGPFVELVVTDAGVGMDDANRARVFEPYFTTTPVPASGCAPDAGRDADHALADVADRGTGLKLRAWLTFASTDRLSILYGSRWPLTKERGDPSQRVSVGRTQGHPRRRGRSHHRRQVVARHRRDLPGDELSLKKVENNWAEMKAGKVSYRFGRQARRMRS